MANTEISNLPAIGANTADGDLLPIVDISEAAPADKTKKVTAAQLAAYVEAKNLSGTVNKTAVFKTGGGLKDGLIQDNGATLGVGIVPVSNIGMRLALNSGAFLSGFRSQLTSTTNGSSAVEGLNLSATAKVIGSKGDTGSAYTSKGVGVQGVASGTPTILTGAIALEGVAGNPSKENYGIVATATPNSTEDNRAFYFEVANGGAGEAFIGQLIDGTERLGKGITIVDPDGNAKLTDIVISEEITLSSAQILGLFTTKIQIIAPQGVGTYIKVESTTINYTFDTGAYVGGGDVQITTDTADVIQYELAMITAVNDVIRSMTEVFASGTTDTQLVENKGIFVQMAAANPTVGAGTMKINVSYRVLDV